MHRKIVNNKLLTATLLSCFYFNTLLEALTTFTVTTNIDTPSDNGGQGTTNSLRFFINQTNLLGPDTYVINFNCSPTIQLAGMLPLLNLKLPNNLTIDGTNGGSNIVLDGNALYPGFIASQGTILIENITVQNALAHGGTGGGCGGGGMGAGGALFIDGAAVTLSNVTLGTAGKTNQAIGGNGLGGLAVMGGGGGMMSGNGGSSPALSTSSAGGGGLGGLGGNGSGSTVQGGGGGIGPNGAGGTASGAGSAGGGFGGASGGAGVGGGAGGANAGGGGSSGVNSGAGGGGNGGVAGSGVNGGSGKYGGGGGGGSGGLIPGAGGDGGFGGGGGGGINGGGDGGFGGGGGAGATIIPGAGGYGGGGGSNAYYTSLGNVGGLGGGNGDLFSSGGLGGGGAGFGGAIFVNTAASSGGSIGGGSLTVTGPLTIQYSSAAAGTGANNGATAGAGIFSSGIGALTFSSSSTVTIYNAISDDNIYTVPSGQGYGPGNVGSGVQVVQSGTGTLQLLGTNTYAGGVKLSSGTLSINSDSSLGKPSTTISVGGNATLQSYAASPAITSSARPINLQTFDLTFDTNSNTITWNGVISDSGAGVITKINPGTLELLAANTYGGGTNLNGGVLSINSDASLGTAGTTITVGGNAALKSYASSPAITSSRPINLQTFDLRIDTNSNTITLNGIISDTGGAGVITKINAGTLELLAANTYGGGTNLNAGTLTINSDASLGVAGTTLTVGGNATLKSYTGAAAFSSSRQILLGANNLTIDTNSNTIKLNGVISGPNPNGSLTLIDSSGSGTLTLTAVNTYQGGTTITGGTLALSATGYLYNLGSVAVESPGLFDLSNVSGNRQIGNLSDGGTSGGKVLLPPSGFSLTTFVTGTSRFSGVIEDGTSSTNGIFIKDGPGTLILSGTSNTYTGSTGLNNGTLQFYADGSLGAFNTPINVTGNSTLQAGAGPIPLTTHPISLGANTLTFDTNGFDVTWNDVISGGAGVLKKVGAGTLALLGTNTYGGGTELDAGTIAINTNQSLGALGTTLTVGGNATLQSYTGASPITETRPIGLGVYNLTIDTNSNTITWGGVISGSNPNGSITLIDSSGSGTLTLTAANTYQGGTTITGGTLALSGAGALYNLGNVTLEYPGVFDLSLVNVNRQIGALSDGGVNGGTVKLPPSGYSLTTVVGGTSTFSGVIEDGTTSGVFIKDGGGTLVLSGTNNTYTGSTGLNAGTLQIFGDGSLGAPGIPLNVTGSSTLQAGATATSTHPITFGANTLTIDTQGYTLTDTGGITGTSGNLIKEGTGTLILTGTSSYSGGTTVNAGVLQGNTNSLQGNIAVNSNTLVFSQSFSGIFNGTITGTPAATMAIGGGGPGTKITFNTPQAGFKGQTNVYTSNLNLNSTLGGNVTVYSNATISGTGTVLGNLTINGGGTISPGNSGPGTFTVNGNYQQLPDSTYVWEFINNSQMDLVNIGGTASLAGNFTGLFTGTPNLNQRYLVLHANGGVSGTYANVQLPPPPSSFIAYTLVYDPNNVYVALDMVLTNIAQTPNQENVANQIDSIVNPTADQAEVLNAFVGLSDAQAREALDELSGEQYTYVIQMARYTNEQLKNGIYNAIRNTLLPCWRPVCCEKIETWFQADMGKFTTNGDRNSAGLNGTNWDVTLGAHFPVCAECLFGLACNYQRDYITFKQGGRTTRQTGQVAGYVIGRSDTSYVFAEVLYGATTSRYHRPIVYGNLSRIAKSNPKSTQGMFYGELGLNFPFCCPINFLIQPFIGLEYGHYDQNKIKEHGAGSIDLTLKKVNKISFDSLLGIHATTDIECIEIGVDLAWQYCYTNPRVKTKNTFEDIGSEFPIQGCKFGRSGARGNVRASYDISSTYNIYADVRGETWDKWTSYGFDFGINGRW